MCKSINKSNTYTVPLKRPLSLPKNGCPDKCNISGVDPVEDCGANSADDCLDLDCCWFPTELNRPKCFRAAKVSPSARSFRPMIPDFIPTLAPSEDDFSDIFGFQGEIDMIDLEYESSWTSWVTQPCAAPCNGVGLQG